MMTIPPRMRSCSRLGLKTVSTISAATRNSSPRRRWVPRKYRIVSVDIFFDLSPNCRIRKLLRLLITPTRMTSTQTRPINIAKLSTAWMIEVFMLSSYHAFRCFSNLETSILVFTCFPEIILCLPVPISQPFRVYLGNQYRTTRP